MKLINLKKIYQDKEVLKDVSVEIQKGEIVGLVGKNGAGKTTLMKIICNNIANYQGTVENNSNLGFLIENPKLYENKSGLYNLNYFSKIFGHTMDDQFIPTLINELELNEVINKKVKNYSLGMKQKLALLIALINKPDILILDEPTNGMDVETSCKVLEFLKELVKEKKISILISSHKLEDVENICSRVLFIDKGEIIKDSPIGKLTEEYFSITFSTLREAERFVEVYKGKIKLITGNEIVVANITGTSELLKLCNDNKILLEDIKFVKNDLRTAYLNGGELA